MKLAGNDIFSRISQADFMPTPEELARINIDRQLTACGWTVQSRVEMNLYAGRGIAVREFPIDGGGGLSALFVGPKSSRRGGGEA